MIWRKGKTMNMKLLLPLLLVPAALPAAQPAVTLVSCEQDPVTRVVTVSYTVANAPAIVTAELTTNGVRVAEGLVKSTIGDINVIVDDRAEAHSFRWLAEKDYPCKFAAADKWGIELTAWSVNDPPDYMAVALATSNTVHFYTSSNAVPGGVQDVLYKTEVLLMRKIPAANSRFLMGSPKGEVGRNDAYSSSAREIQHWVVLTNDFYIGVYELTQRQAKRIASYPGYTVGKIDNLADAEINPMESQTWTEVRDTTIVPKIRARSGIVSFDLPTDAQWEFACRAGTGTALNSGKDLGITSAQIWGTDCPNLDEVAWWTGNASVVIDPEAGTKAGQTHPVGLKPANAFGLYDMHGNVMEMCRDDVTANGDYSDGSEVVEPCALTGSDSKIVRGGSFGDGVGGCRSATRSAVNVWDTNVKIGCRLMCLPYFGK